MGEWFWSLTGWGMLGVVVLPAVAGLGWFVFEAAIRPRLTPRRAIEALADAVMRDHPSDPEEWAFREERAAWYRSDGRGRARWLRVRREIRRRLGR